nr:unnamed protein product [Spirometra erinaceieuropaei]
MFRNLIEATGSSTCTCRPDVHITKAVVTIIATAATTTTADIVLIAVGGICESVSNGSCKLLESSHYVQKQPTFTSCAECSLSPFRALSAADMAPVGLTTLKPHLPSYLPSSRALSRPVSCLAHRMTVPQTGGRQHLGAQSSRGVTTSTTCLHQNTPTAAAAAAATAATNRSMAVE